MKIKLFLKFAIVGIASMFFASCNNIVTKDVDGNGKSEVAKRINDLKEQGLLDQLINSNRSVNDEESIAIMNFINNTDDVLTQIQNSENGTEKLAVINALFSDSDITDFANCFAKIDNKGADEFLNYINSAFYSNEGNSRSISEINTIKLLYNTNNLKDLNSRGAYASDLEWSTIGWYTGFCASTIAGFYLLSYGGFWLKIAGTVAATAGTASMVAQLIIWNNCSDLGSFVSSLINQDGKTATKILNSDSGVKLGTIVTETAATVAACYFTPAGKAIVNSVVYYINLIMEKILAVLPTGINYTINGIPLKLITL